MSWQNDPITPAQPSAPAAPWDKDPIVGPTPRQVLTAAAAMKADAVAEAERLAKRYPAPAEVIMQDLEAYRLQEVVDLSDSDLQKAPMLRELMRRDVKLAAMAQDDIPTLTKVGNFVGDLGGAAKAGVFRASRGAAGTFQAGFELIAPALDFLEPITVVGGNPLRRLAEGFAMRGQAAGQTAAVARPKTDGIVSGGFFSGIESLTQNLLTLPMAFAPGGQAAALGGMTAFTGGDAYQQAREKGLPMSQAMPFAASQAAIEYATEKLPLGALLKDVKAGAGFLQILGRQIALEVPGEQIATVLQDLNEWAILNPEKPFTSYLEDRPSAAAQTLIATIVGTGGNVAVAKGIEAMVSRAVSDGANMQQAGLAGQALEQALQAAEASRLRERSPEQFRALMTQMAEDGSVYVDAEVLNQMPAELLQRMEGVAEAMPEALLANAPVAVKLADVLTLAPGTPQAEVFMQNARSAPDAPSLIEAEEAGRQAQQFLQQEAQRVIQQAQDQEAMRASSEAVRQSILAELNTAGRYRGQVNEAMSQWAGAFYTAYSAKLGITPEEMYQRYRLRVLGAPSGTPSPVMEQGPTVQLADGYQSVAIGDSTVEVSVKDGHAEISMVRTPQDKRGQGSARNALTEVLRAADARGLVVTLTPDPMDRKTSKAKLEGFYRSLGFRPNKGRNKDYRYAGAMIREPRHVLGQGPRGTFNPASLELVLNPNANLSTFFHETGHFFLEVMADIASQPDAPAQIVEDMNTFLRWAGVPDLATWRSMTLDQQRPYHERWAESIEQYVMEGRAPSVELQPLMRRFATWLKSVYGSIKAFLASRGVVTGEGGETLGQGAGDQTQTEAFKRWFGGSKVVDAEGKPLVVYHGTNQSFDTFDPEQSREGDSLIFVTPNRRVASDFAMYRTTWGGANVMPVYVKAEKLLEVQGGGRNIRDVENNTKLEGMKYGETVRDFAARQGYDGIVFRQVRDPVSPDIDPVDDVYALFPSAQIKSATGNDGTFDANDPSILSQGDQPSASNLQLNDDIRRVMDRMLATDEQIAQANEVAGMLPDEQADGEAAERLQKRSMADLKWSVKARDKVIAKLKREAREIEKATRAAVTAEVDATPEMQAKRKLDELRKAKQLDDASTAAVADAFGYESVEAMLQAIDAFGSRAEAIDGLTERRMLEEHGDLIDDRAIQEAANEAVHNEARARSLASELRAQQEMLNQRADTGQVNARGARITVNTLVEAAKQFGANVIARTPLRDLKSTAWKHTAAERRAGRRWQEATMAGDTAAAVKAKQDQMLNNAAAKAALDAAAESKKIVEFFRRVVKGGDEKTVEKGRDPDIVSAARAVLAAYGIETPTTKAAAAYLEALQQNDPETAGVVGPMILRATQNAQPLEALTFEELQGLHESIQAMWHLAKRSRQMEVDGNLMDIDEAADELYARMEAIGIPDTVPGEAGALTKAELVKRAVLQQAPALLRRVEQWAEAKDGKFGGPFLRLIFQPIKDAADRYRAERLEYRKKFQALVDTIAPMMPTRPIEAPEIGYTFGRGHNGIGMAELLHAILHTGNESNKRKLLLGRGWAAENPDGTLDTSRWDAFIQRLANTGVLQREHFEFAQGVWDLLEQTKPLAQKTHRDVFGRYFAEVTADGFTDPFGVARRGGYVPAQADPLLVQDAELRDLLETENAGMSYAFPSTNRGFTKSRVEYNRPLKLDLRSLPQHIDKVLLFSHMEAPVRSAARLIKRPKVSQPLGRIDPAAISGVLRPWLSRSARQTVETPMSADAGMNRMMSTIRGRVGMALMFANISNTLQQITGVSAAAIKVKPGLMMRSLAGYIANPKRFTAAVWDASPYMADRASNEVAVLSDTLEQILINPGVYASAEQFTRRHSYFLQTAFDNVLSPIIWQAAYNQGLVDGMEERMAIRFADGVIRQTQGSTLPEDVSRIETGPAYARIFTQFVGYFNMLANTNATALQQIAREHGLRKGAGKAFSVLMLGLMVPIWVAEAIALGFKGGPDDEDDDGYLDDWLAKVIGFGTIKGVLSGVPFVGALGQSVVNRFNDQPADDKFSLSPTVSVLESAAGAPASVYKAIVDDASGQKAVRDVAALITVTTGLPAMTLARPVGYSAGVAQGKIEPTSEADMVRGLLTGTASPDSRSR